MGRLSEYAYVYGAPIQMHYTNTFWGSYQHCNTSRQGPHVGDRGIHGCKLLLFAKTPDCKMDAGTCSEKGSWGTKWKK